MKRQLNRVTFVAVPLVLATLVTSPMAARQQGSAPQKATDAKPQPPPTKADLKDVVRHIDNYLGKTIEVEGEVLDVVPPHMMVIDARRWFHPWGGVLVVTGVTNVDPNGPIQAEVLDQREVRVTLRGPLDGNTVTFNYRISNGLAEAEGTITVVELPIPDQLQPPLATDDEVTVRVVTRTLLEENLGLDTWFGAFVVALADRFREVDEQLAAQLPSARK